MYNLEPIYRLTAKIGDIDGLQNAEVGDKVEIEARIAITGTSLEVDVYHNEEIISKGVTRVPAIVKTKYTKGTPGEAEKRKWRVAIFSLIKKY
jgi:acyl-CoA hydrolase